MAINPIGADRRPWTVGLIIGFVGLLMAGLGVRALMWPQPGFVSDLDQFVLWVHGIAVLGWGHAYQQDLSFPAVMAWVWGTLAAAQPAFATVVDSSDPAIRVLMKVPASLADLGIAAGIAWWFRDRPRLAIVAAGAVLLWPATWYVSAWWGQYEPIYVLPALLAVLAVRAKRPGVAAALLAISLMTKPQALPFLVPFAASFLATEGLRGSLRAAAIAGVVAFVAWLPFLAAGGPANYLRNLGAYQNELYAVLSINAWNPWTVVQVVRASGGFISDQTSILGPLTFRDVGLGAMAIVAGIVFAGVYRRPSPERLAMGLTAISLGAFVALTTMHERYAYPALVFLVLLWPRRDVVIAWLALAIAYALDLAYAVPPFGGTPPFGQLVPIVGSVVITVLALIAIRWTWRGLDEVDVVARGPMPTEVTTGTS